MSWVSIKPINDPYKAHLKEKAVRLHIIRELARKNDSNNRDALKNLAIASKWLDLYMEFNGVKIDNIALNEIQMEFENHLHFINFMLAEIQGIINVLPSRSCSSIDIEHLPIIDNVYTILMELRFDIEFELQGIRY